MAAQELDGQVALILGAGPGLGLALGRRCASAGMKVALAARDGARVAEMAEEFGSTARGYGCDATRERDVDSLYAQVTAELGAPDLVVYNAGAFVRRNVVDIEAEDFERCWRVGCLGGFLLGRAAARGMLPRAHGTIVFTGATASLRGGAGFANLAVGKFGLRALAQSMARELGPQGVHVAHVIVDGQIRSERRAPLAAERPPDGLLAPEAIADAVLDLHRQHRSAWTFELDVRPWVEKF